MRPKGSPKELERRRRRAMGMWGDGSLSLNEIARRIGCGASSVMRWRDAMLDGGEGALEPKAVPGWPAKLTEGEKGKLIEYLLEGAMAHGYSTELWTTQRIADLIRKKFRVTYHRDHVGRLMHGLRWSHQKPERRAIERDEEEIERWKKEEWPRIKKKLRGWRPTSSS